MKTVVLTIDTTNEISIIAAIIFLAFMFSNELYIVVLPDNF